MQRYSISKLALYLQTVSNLYTNVEITHTIFELIFTGYVCVVISAARSHDDRGQEVCREGGAGQRLPAGGERGTGRRPVRISHPHPRHGRPPDGLASRLSQSLPCPACGHCCPSPFLSPVCSP